jgi:hypothetical protein
LAFRLRTISILAKSLPYGKIKKTPVYGVFFIITFILFTETSTYWDESPDDHILFQTLEIINLAGNSSIDKDASGFLERGG